MYRRLGYGDFLEHIMDCDITEIPGADNLFQTEGIIRETQEKYQNLYGVKKSYLLINGTSVPGYGGGTCQVSSTLYNALLQLPGIEILQRRPHGPDGAKYLPHGVDAAVGSDVPYCVLGGTALAHHI